MALNKELLQKQQELKELTDEQIQAIVNLSVNDENNVIGERIGRVYGELDNDIKEGFGIEKRQGEKTYDYLKRAGKTLKEKITEYSEKVKKVDELEQEKQKLEKQLKDGNTDEILTKKLQDQITRYEDLEKKYNREKEELEGKMNTYEQQINETKLNYEFDKAAAGLNFKPEVDEELQEILLSSAKQKVLSTYKPDWIEEGEGKVRLVFRDADGKIQHNPEKGLQPYSANDLLKKNLQKVLAEKKEGGGTRKPTGGSSSDQLPDISTARTQVEADEVIQKHLTSMGVPRGKEFYEKQKEMRKEAEVEKLPIT